MCTIADKISSQNACLKLNHRLLLNFYTTLKMFPFLFHLRKQPINCTAGKVWMTVWKFFILFFLSVFFFFFFLFELLSWSQKNGKQIICNGYMSYSINTCNNELMWNIKRMKFCNYTLLSVKEIGLSDKN